MKLTILLAAVLLQVSAYAAPTLPNQLTTRDDANPPYILQVHSCDISNMQRRDDGSTFASVMREPSNVYLAVTPMVYEKLSREGVRDWLRYMESNKELFVMKSKIKTFEDNGNIAAMKHWEEKLQKEMAYRQGYFKQLVFGKFITKTVSDNSIKKYYQPNFGWVKKYQSLDEMGGDFENYCNVKNNNTEPAKAVIPTTLAPMACQLDSDCGRGQSCRSRKGGGAECRLKESASSMDEVLNRN